MQLRNVSLQLHLILHPLDYSYLYYVHLISLILYWAATYMYTTCMHIEQCN